MKRYSDFVFLVMIAAAACVVMLLSGCGKETPLGAPLKSVTCTHTDGATTIALRIEGDKGEAVTSVRLATSGIAERKEPWNGKIPYEAFGYKFTADECSP